MPCLQTDPEAYKVAYEQYEQYQAQLAAYEAQQPQQAEESERRPSWLQEIAAKPDESPAEPEPAQAVGPDGRVWDERWGYCTPEQLRRINSKGKGKAFDGKGKGKGGGGGGGGKGGLHVVSGGRGGHYAVSSSAPAGPPKRGYKLQVCSEHPATGTLPLQLALV